MIITRNGDKYSTELRFQSSEARNHYKGGWHVAVKPGGCVQCIPLFNLGIFYVEERCCVLKSPLPY